MSRPKTPMELVERLGGPSRASVFFGVSPQVIWNWTNRAVGSRRPPRIPPELYFEHRAKLERAGIRNADKRIWGFDGLPEKD